MLRTTALTGSPFALTRAEQDAPARSGSRCAVAPRARAAGAPTLATHLASTLAASVDPTRGRLRLAARRASLVRVRAARPRPRGARPALGEAVELEARGPERFATVAARWRELAGGARSPTRRGRPTAAGRSRVGGFAFAPDGGGVAALGGLRAGVADRARGRAHARAERGGRERVAPDAGGARVARRHRPRSCSRACSSASRRAARARRCRCSTPRRPGASRSSSAMPPEHYEAAVARAVELIAAGELEKIVLAREVQVHAPRRYDPAAVFGVLREEFPSCFVFCVGRGDATLIAASPELLVRREGQRVEHARAGRLHAAQRRPGRRRPPRRAAAARSRATARSTRSSRGGSSARCARTRSGSPRRPSRTLVRIANIQHLATPIRAQLAAPIEALELAGLMHPTPAVGGEPLARGRAADPGARGPRPRLVRRARSAGPTPTGDGEFCVALRCALLRGARRPLLRRQRHRARLRPGRRAGRDRGQAGGAAAAARRAERARPTASHDARVQRDVRVALAAAPR